MPTESITKQHSVNYIIK